MYITLDKTFLESSVHHIFGHKLPARQKMLSGSYCPNISLELIAPKTEMQRTAVGNR